MKLSVKLFTYITFGVLAALVLFTYFYNIFTFHPPVAPGDDNIRHVTVVKEIIKTGVVSSSINSFDPPLFHLTVANVALITHQPANDVMKYFAPFIAVLAVLSIYFVIRRLFGSSGMALLGVAIYALFSPQPKLIYSDGTFLNLFAAVYLLLFALTIFVLHRQSLDKRPTRITWLAILFSSSVLLSHSLSAMYLLAILGVYVLLDIAKSVRLRRWPDLKTLAFYGGILVALPFTWKYYLGGTIEKVFSILGIHKISDTNILRVDLASSVGGLPQHSTFIWLLGGLVINLAILGIIVSIVRYRYHKQAILLLLIWSVTLFIGSRSFFFQLPVRYARDLAQVAVILATFGIWTILRSINVKFRGLIILPLLGMLLLALPARLSSATLSDPMIRVQRSDELAMNWIKQNTDPNDVILGVPQTIVASSWGSYIEILTDRVTLDATACPTDDDNKCDVLFNPNSHQSARYYTDQSIDYVYAGHIILGPYLYKNDFDWNYKTQLNTAIFLQPVADFLQPELGSVTIYRVDKIKLQQLLESFSDET